MDPSSPCSPGEVLSTDLGVAFGTVNNTVAVQHRLSLLSMMEPGYDCLESSVYVNLMAPRQGMQL